MWVVESDAYLKTPTQIVKELRSSIQWIETEFGFNVSPTRIASYEKYLSNKSKIESIEDYEKYLFTAREIEDFLQVSNVFKEKLSSGISHQIKNILSGKYYRIESALGAEDPSRDFLFELSIASRFIKAGFDVSVCDDCDVVADVYGKTVFIECKRVKSDKQLMKRLKKANEQIEKRIGIKKVDKVGYISLDITDILSKQFSITQYANIEQIKADSYIKIENYINKYKPQIRSKVNKKVFGVIFSLNTFGLIKSTSNEEVDQVFNVTTMYAVCCEKTKVSRNFNESVLDKLC